jgi:hypothetical protein
MFKLIGWFTIDGFFGGSNGVKWSRMVGVDFLSCCGVGLFVLWDARRATKRLEEKEVQARRDQKRAEDEARRRSRYQKEAQKTPNGEGSKPPPNATPAEAPDAKIHPSRAFWREYDKLLKPAGGVKRPDGGRSSSGRA